MEGNGYTFVELSDMHFAYGAALGNAVADQRLYQERYPNKRLPPRPMFTSIAQRLRDNYNNINIGEDEISFATAKQSAKR